MSLQKDHNCSTQIKYQYTISKRRAYRVRENEIERSNITLFECVKGENVICFNK